MQKRRLTGLKLLIQGFQVIHLENCKNVEKVSAVMWKRPVLQRQGAKAAGGGD